MELDFADEIERTGEGRVLGVDAIGVCSNISPTILGKGVTSVTPLQFHGHQTY